jgi:hypothetical protein
MTAAGADVGSPINIESELWPAIERARHPRVAPMLADFGISPRLQTAWGLAKVEFFGKARAFYQPAADGAFALIAAVVEFGDLADLCAIELPSQHVGTRLGLGKALGLDGIDDCRWNGSDLALVERPVDWLRKPEGAFIIDWETAAFTLNEVRPITCNSLGLATRVERAFLRPLPVPELLVAT